MGCYEKISEVLKLVEEEARGREEDTQQLVCSVFKAFSAVTANCPPTRQDFEHRVGHSPLLALVANITTPSETVLQEVLGMVSQSPSHTPSP